MELPNKYKFLLKEKAPAILVEALKYYGTKEVPGKKHNPIILEWAKAIGWGHIQDDETPWCGTFIGYVAKQANVQVVNTPIRALSWNNYGIKQDVAMLGDILTFSRNGGGHVGIYVGEDKDYYHVLGGNQSNMVNITRIAKSRLSQIRRTAWKIAQPSNVRCIYYDANGEISENEK